jgi:hypothetical protein
LLFSWPARWLRQLKEAPSSEPLARAMRSGCANNTFPTSTASPLAWSRSDDLLAHVVEPPWKLAGRRVAIENEKDVTRAEPLEDTYHFLALDKRKVLYHL